MTIVILGEGGSVAVLRSHDELELPGTYYMQYTNGARPTERL